jgi:hypothetical protein
MVGSFATVGISRSGSVNDVMGMCSESRGVLLWVSERASITPNNPEELAPVYSELHNPGLLWVAPDTAGVSSLWHAPLTSLIPERQKPIDARALTRLSDGTLRVLQIQNDSVVIGRYQGAVFIGETIVPGVPAAPDLAGIWQENDVLLQAGNQAWLLNLDAKE